MNKSTFKQYFYQAHCETDYPSSKRLYGGIGWVICQLCLITACVLEFIKGVGLTELLKDMWTFDLITSSALLGLSTITSALGLGKTLQINHKQKIEKENDIS